MSLGKKNKPNNIIPSLQKTIDEVKLKIINDANISKSDKEKLLEVNAYVVSSARGVAWFNKGYFSVPLWAYEKQEMSNKQFRKKYKTWDKKWFDSNKGRDGYFVYYIAHELSHFLCKIKGQPKCGNHSLEFYQSFKKLCPYRYQFYELNYIKTSSKYGVPTYEQCKITPINEQTPSSEFCSDGNLSKALKLKELADKTTSKSQLEKALKGIQMAINLSGETEDLIKAKKGVEMAMGLSKSPTKKVEIYKNGFLWESFEFKSGYHLQSKVQQSIDNEMSVFQFLQYIDKIKDGGILKFNSGTTIKII